MSIQLQPGRFVKAFWVIHYPPERSLPGGAIVGLMYTDDPDRKEWKLSIRERTDTGYVSDSHFEGTGDGDEVWEETRLGIKDFSDEQRGEFHTVLVDTDDPNLQLAAIANLQLAAIADLPGIHVTRGDDPKPEELN